MIDELNTMFLTAPKPDVIISRGAMASLIETGIPEIVSIRAEPDNLDLVEMLNLSKRHGNKMGLLLYEEYAHSYKIETVRELLHLQNLRLYPFRTKEDIVAQIYQGKADGMDVLVGGGTLAERTGKLYGIPVCSVKSGKSTLEKAVRQAEAIIYARQQEKLQIKCFSSAASSIQEGILSLENRRIVVANEGIGEILGINEMQLPGKLVHELPGDVVDAAFLRFLSEETDDDAILLLNGQNYYARRSTVGEKGRKQTILVFQNTRIIQLQEVRRIGAQKNVFVDIRVIAASNKNLKKLIDQGRFRVDLYYRLNTLKLSLPDLAERAEDILPLARHFIRRHSAKYAVTPPELSKEDMGVLMDSPWEGNTRELENVMHRFVILRKMLRTCSIQDCFDQAEPISPRDDALPFSGTLEEAEQAAIRACLRRHSGNKARTAEELGISRSTLWKKLQQPGMTEL